MPRITPSAKSSAAKSEPPAPQEAGLEPNLIVVDDVSYDANSLPEEIRALLKDLLRFNQELEELQYKLRKVQAAQHIYYETIKAELIAKKVSPCKKVGA